MSSTISESVSNYCNKYKLITKEDFKRHCTDTKEFYTEIEENCPQKWNSIKTPKDSARYYLQTMLVGYKIYKRKSKINTTKKITIIVTIILE